MQNGMREDLMLTKKDFFLHLGIKTEKTKKRSSQDCANRSRTPGNLPILSCAGGIPDGFVELGTVPNPERTERLFFGYDGTDAETGTLRTGVWYRSRPILPSLIFVR